MTSGQGFEGALISSVCSELGCFCIPPSSLCFFAKNEAIDGAPEDFEISSNLLAFKESDVIPGFLQTIGEKMNNYSSFCYYPTFDSLYSVSFKRVIDTNNIRGGLCEWSIATVEGSGRG